MLTNFFFWSTSHPTYLGNGGEFLKKQWWPSKETVSGTFLCICRLVSHNILHRSLFVDHEFDYRQNWMKGSPVTMQWVKTMTKFEREIIHRLYVFIKKLNKLRKNKVDTQQVLSTYTGMTCQLFVYTAQLLALHVHCPTDAQIGLRITNHFQEFYYSFDKNPLISPFA